MKLSELGEFGLIDRIKQQFGSTDDSCLGIGDDCAVIPESDTESLLLTTDLLIEDVHFLRDHISARELGHKSIAVNLSDLAAMGAKAHSVFVSLALPAETEVAWVEEFYAGAKKLLDQYEIRLLGGDTTKSPEKISISVTAMGRAKNATIKYRHTAQVGDNVYVTGPLGDSAAGLQALLNQEAAQSLIDRHHRPEPHLCQGQWLAEQSEVHAMMDVSDGLSLDLQRMAEASGCGFEIELERLPLSKELKAFAEERKRNPREMAALGGEDYVLLFTAAAHFKAPSDIKVHRIGKVTAEAGGIQFLHQGDPIHLKTAPFEHF